MARKAGTQIQIQQIEPHRNGVSGEPFYAVLFLDPSEPEARFVASVFPGEGTVAVLEIGRLAAGDIEFGSNSWRGDRYEPALRRAIAEYEGAEAVPCMACGVAGCGGGCAR